MTDTQDNPDMTLSAIAIGNSVGFILPQKARAKLRVKKGDKLYLTEAEDGYRLTPYDPVFEKKMKIARKIMDERRDVLRELAK